MSRQGAHKREKRLKRLFGVSTIILSLLIAFIPNFVYAASKKGTNWGIDWEISGNTLTISPAKTPLDGHTAGQMNDEWIPSTEDMSTVTKIVVASGIDHLGAALCGKFNSGNITSISLNAPATIPAGTIRNHPGISSLEFGEGVTTIESGAVTTDSISTLTLPASLTSTISNNFCKSSTEYNIAQIVTPTASEGEDFLERINESTLEGTVTNSKGLIALFHKDTSGSPQREGRTYIKDMRTTKTSHSSIRASTSGNKNSDFVLEVNDAGTDLKSKLPSKVTDSVIYDLVLKTPDGQLAPEICTITLPIVDHWDTDNKKIYAYSTRNGSVYEFNATVVDVDDVKCAQFRADHYSEYGIGLTNESASGGSSSGGSESGSSSSGGSESGSSSSGGSSKKSSSKEEKTYTITVKDERTEKSDSRYISAKVSNLEQNLVLVVKDSDGAEIQKSLVVPNKGIVKYVDLDLQNDKGEGVVGYGTCTVTLPIPQEMDLTKGSVKVMAFDANNALKEISSKIVEVSGKKCVKFNPPHFSEFALVYTPFSGNTTNGNGNGNAGGTSGNRAATGNKVIMPKTGGGDEIRYILSAFLFLFGTVQLITSVTKKVKTA